MGKDSRPSLASYIGQTWVTLTSLTLERGPLHPRSRATSLIGEQESMGNTLAYFPASYNVCLSDASCGAAGPVVQDRARVTNPLWGVDILSHSRALDCGPGHIHQERLPSTEAKRPKGRNAGSQAGPWNGRR